MFFLFFAIALLSSKLAHAQASATLPEITVEAARPPSDRTLHPSSVRVFTANDFKDRAIALPDWLERESGLHVSHLGDESAPTAVSIRGSTSDQVAVYLNGILLNPASGGGVNLSQLSLHQIERITVYKGKVPLAAGGQPIGGAVFIETARPARGREVDASLRGGSFGTVEGFAAYSETHDRFSLDASYNAFHSEGDFTFLDDNGTPVNAADDTRVARRNNASTIHDWQLRLNIPVSAKASLEAFTRLYREDRGIPGLGSFQSTTADYSDTQSLTALNLRYKGVFAPSVDYTQKNSFLFEKSQFSDPNAEIGIGNPQDNDDLTFHYTHQDLVDWTLPSAGPLQSVGHLLWSYDWETFTPEDYASSPTTAGSDSRHRFEWGGELETSLWQDRLLMSGTASYLQLRNDFDDQDPSTSNPSAFTNTRTEHLATGAIQGEFALVRDLLSIDADLVRAVRPPHFFELFGDRGNVVGNPALSSEKSWNASGGVKLSRDFAAFPLRSLFLSAAYFERRSSNLIQFEETGGNIARATNVGKSLARGLELSGAFNLWKHIDLETSYTLQKVEDKTSDQEVPGHPRTTLFNEVRVRRPLGPGELALSGSWQYEDGRYLDPNNSRRVAHAHDIGAEASYLLCKRYRFFAQAKNLTNNQLVDVVGYPLPGRAFTGGLAWTFSTKETHHDALHNP